MFTDSPGPISPKMCFSFKGGELGMTVGVCLDQVSPQDDCSEGPDGPIGEWDVSSENDQHEGLVRWRKRF